MLANGVFLNDRYEILGRVGSGGMSDVYKAKCHKLNRFVAIKVLKQEYSEDKNFVAKFRVEAQSAAGLSHPNIVSIYDVGEDNGFYYIVMELVEGITLKNYIEKKGRLDAKEAVSIAIQVAQGIQTAHSHHIIHRDIKPQNIIISKEGKVKVTDFGIARASSAQTINSNAMGSVHYISPEQARGNYSDERSDIYSLGISLYEMITGRVPFDGDTTVSVALQHIQSEIPSPKEMVSDLPISVEKIIYKCTQKKPERRYAKAGELIADLKQSLQTPEEDFVQIPIPNSSAQTISMTPQELEYIKMESSTPSVERKQETSVEVLVPSIRKKESPAVKGEVRQAKQLYIEPEVEMEEEKVNPKVEKVMTIISVAAAILIVCLLVFIIVKLLPNTKQNSNQQTTTQTLETTTKKESTTTSASGESTTSNTSSTSNANGNATTATSKMPNLKDMSEADALIALNQVNLGMDKSYENSNQVQKGYVISQEFTAGSDVKKNTSVKVVISLGPDQFQVPDVLNLKESDAIMMLESYQLHVSTEYTYHDTVVKGNVISSNPSHSTMVSQGDNIVLNISMGPEFVNVIMPDLRNLTEAEAKFKIESNGLIVGKIETAHSSEIAEGRVISQSLEKNGTVKQGTTVDFVVSLGEEETEPVTSSTPTGTVTVTLAQVAEYISGGSFAVPVVPGPGMVEPTYYAEATLRLELVQTTEDGRTISRVVNTLTVTPSQFPYVEGGIVGEPNLTEGSVRVYLIFGGEEHFCGSCLVDFQ